MQNHNLPFPEGQFLYQSQNLPICRIWFSYLDFHGGQDTKGWTLEELNRIDALQEGTSNSFAGRKAVFQKMAESARFSETRMHHAIALTDPEIEAIRREAEDTKKEENKR